MSRAGWRAYFGDDARALASPDERGTPSLRASFEPGTGSSVRYARLGKGELMRRLHSLDGLRGIAALVVLVMHVMLTSDVFAEPVLHLNAPTSLSWWQWALIYTPLHLAWDGSVAVYIFFILSGVVLTLPIVSQGSKFSWRSYYPKRLIRLYLPVWGAVVVGTLIALMIPRKDDASYGTWLSSRPGVTSSGVVRDLTLVAGPSDVISPLWTLQWEVLFSVLLPLYAVFALKLRVAWWIKMTLVLAAVGAGVLLGYESVAYMSMFAIGSVLATVLPRLGAARRSSALASATLLAIILATARWLALGAGANEAVLNLLRLVAVIGAGALVVLAVTWLPLNRWLSGSLSQWLGAVSFSLYLIHEPIVLGVSYLVGPDWVWFAIPISLGAAWIFWRVVEAPSHRLAQYIGRHLLPKEARIQSHVSTVDAQQPRPN